MWHDQKNRMQKKTQQKILIMMFLQILEIYFKDFKTVQYFLKLNPSSKWVSKLKIQDLQNHITLT